MISLAEESMVSEHLRVRNKSCCFITIIRMAHFASLEMLSGVYAGVIFWVCHF